MQPSESINNSLLSCLHALEIKINCNKFMLLRILWKHSGWAKLEPFQRRPSLKNLSNLQCRNFVCQSKVDLDFVLIQKKQNKNIK